MLTSEQAEEVVGRSQWGRRGGLTALSSFVMTYDDHVSETSARVPRALDLDRLLPRKSRFLPGPRQTSKTTLIRLPASGRAALRPARQQRLPRVEPLAGNGLGSSSIPGAKFVAIDLIQRVPELWMTVSALRAAERNTWSRS